MASEHGLGNKKAEIKKETYFVPLVVVLEMIWVLESEI